VPFTVLIPEKERDPHLAEKLWNQERHAILRWCIDGCLWWQRIGLAPPSIVLDATLEYFDEQDELAQWIEDCTNPKAGPQSFELSELLFASWKRWCEPRNLTAGSEKSFVESLKNLGFQKRRRPHGRGFSGITLKGHDGS